MSTPPDLPDTSDLPAGRGGTGPLSDPGAITGGPIDDPTLADRANPRWNDPTSVSPDAPGLGGPGEGEPGSGTDRAPRTTGAIDGDGGSPQDQAAQELEGQLQVGRDNIREGRGDVQSNPALAEGGDNG